MVPQKKKKKGVVYLFIYIYIFATFSKWAQLTNIEISAHPTCVPTAGSDNSSANIG